MMERPLAPFRERVHRNCWTPSSVTLFAQRSTETRNGTGRASPASNAIDGSSHSSDSCSYADLVVCDRQHKSHRMVERISCAFVSCCLVSLLRFRQFQ